MAAVVAEAVAGEIAEVADVATLAVAVVPAGMASVACTRVNGVMFVTLCAETI